MESVRLTSPPGSASLRGAYRARGKSFENKGSSVFGCAILRICLCGTGPVPCSNNHASHGICSRLNWWIISFCRHLELDCLTLRTMALCDVLCIFLWFSSCISCWRCNRIFLKPLYKVVCFLFGWCVWGLSHDYRFAPRKTGDRQRTFAHLI